MKKIILLILSLLLALAIPISLAACESEETDTYYAKITVKDYGDIILKLDRSAAPITVDNFVSLVESEFYDGLTFHRVVRDFMIQGGDPKGDGSGDGPNTIKGEFSSNGYENPISHKRGTVSMARSDSPDSASCQFFICSADSEFLDGNYAAFGSVISGMEVVDAIVEKVFPLTLYADLYGTAYHQYWQLLGNGSVEKSEDKPIIESIRLISEKDATAKQ